MSPTGYVQLRLDDEPAVYVCLLCDGISKREDLHRCAAHGGAKADKPKREPRPRAVKIDPTQLTLLEDAS